MNLNKCTELNIIIDIISNNEWPFHGDANPSIESIKQKYDKKGFEEAYTINFENQPIGLINVMDIEDPTVIIDIRIKKEFQNQGYGKQALRLLSELLFNKYNHIIRIEAHTRIDNYGMRKALYQSGYVKEAYHRQAWEGYDSIGYSIIRDDFKNNTRTEINWNDFPF